MNKSPTNIDEYIANYPEDIQKKLEEFRAFINKLIPEAKETISYGIPTFDLNGKHVVYFGAFKSHLGFFPFPSGVEEFQKLSKEYKTSKGTIKFPYNKPTPWNLVEYIVKFRLKENLEKYSVK